MSIRKKATYNCVQAPFNAIVFGVIFVGRTIRTLKNKAITNDINQVVTELMERVLEKVLTRKIHLDEKYLGIKCYI